MSGEKGHRTYFRWSIRITFGLLLLVLSVTFVLGALLVHETDPPPMAARISFLAVGAFLTILAIRALFVVSVIVYGNRVVVRNILRTHHVPRDTLEALTMPDNEALAQSPLLRLKSGSSVKLFAIGRIRNRMWGDDKGARGLAHELATRLKISLEENPAGAAEHRWG